jgi:hypothetical protein
LFLIVVSPCIVRWCCLVRLALLQHLCSSILCLVSCPPFVFAGATGAWSAHTAA